MPRKPPEHTKWKKGQSGNPKGYPGDSPELKLIKRMTKEELVDIGSLVVKGDVANLKAIAADPKATVIRVMLAAVAVKIINKGDMHALDILLNRLVGKVKDEVKFEGNVPPSIVLTLPDNGRSVKDEEK